MAIKQRGKRGIYWVEFTAPSGERIRTSARTTDPNAAQEYHDKLKAESWRRDVLGQKPAPFFEEVATAFLKAKQDQKKASLDDMARHVAFWREEFGGRRIDAVTRTAVTAFVEGRIQGPGTRNRYIGTLRSMLMDAEADYAESGYRCPKFKTYEEPEGREVWLKPEDFWKLYAVLPECLKDPAIFAVSVGIRQRNLMEMRWDWIDLQRRVVSIPRRSSKNKRPQTKYLNRRAIEILRKQVGKHLIRVFPQFWTAPDGSERTSPMFPHGAFYKALEAIQNDGWYQGILQAYGVSTLRWHDLRHTFASYIGQQNGGARVIQEAGNWESGEMAARYSHFGVDHLAPFFEGIADMLDTNAPQVEVA